MIENGVIDRDKVYTLMDKYFGPVTKSSNGWYSCNCPLCGKEKFAFNPDYLIGKCWRGCFNGFLVDVLRLYFSIDYFEAREMIDTTESGLVRIPSGVNKVVRDAKIKLPVGYHPILDGNTNLAYRAREYLQNRGFDLNYLDRIGLGYCSEADEDVKKNYLGYIIIPFKKSGALIYYIGRDFIGNYLRYKNPEKIDCGVGKMELLFNEEALYLQSKVYLTEGWACAATIGLQGISMQGSIPSTVQRNLIIKSEVKEVIVVTDAGYYTNGLDIAKQLMAYKKVKVINLDYFKENGIGKDVNEIGKENLFNTEDKTQWMDQNFLFRQLRIYTELKLKV